MKTDGSADRLDSRLIGTLVSINVSGGGVPKSRVNGAQVSRLGLVGDAQDDTIHHGGPDRAVCVYSLERTPSLQGRTSPYRRKNHRENVTFKESIGIWSSRRAATLGPPSPSRFCVFQAPEDDQGVVHRRKIHPHRAKASPGMEPSVRASAVRGSDPLRRPRPSQPKDPITRVGLPPERPRF